MGQPPYRVDGISVPEEASPLDRPTVIRARLARAQRFAEPAERITELQREYHASRARDYLLSWLASDPRPTVEHRGELASLLLESGAADAAA